MLYLISFTQMIFFHGSLFVFSTHFIRARDFHWLKICYEFIPRHSYMNNVHIYVTHSYYSARLFLPYAIRQYNHKSITSHIIILLQVLCIHIYVKHFAWFNSFQWQSESVVFAHATATHCVLVATEYIVIYKQIREYLLSNLNDSVYLLANPSALKSRNNATHCEPNISSFDTLAFVSCIEKCKNHSLSCDQKRRSFCH